MTSSTDVSAGRPPKEDWMRGGPGQPQRKNKFTNRGGKFDFKESGGSIHPELAFITGNVNT